MHNLMATEDKVHKSKNNKSKRNLGFENAFKLNQKEACCGSISIKINFSKQSVISRLWVMIE